MGFLKNNIFAIILAGGSGTRFWPLSREAAPKQILQIEGDDTLLRQTIRRIDGFIPPENIWIATTKDQSQGLRFHLKVLGGLGERVQFLEEPAGRNTAPAIGLTAFILQHLSPDSVMVVLPSDHAIPDKKKFLKDIERAVRGAQQDYLVTFGIKPTRPETGYGYIKAVKSSKEQPERFFKVERFCEKPDLKTAKKYLSNGCYFWNSGIFVFKTAKILSEIRAHLPSLYDSLYVMDSMLFDRKDPHLFSIPNSALRTPKLLSCYEQLEPISIDYGVMERSRDILMVPAAFKWVDLGSWAALDEILKRDKAGNIFKGNAIDIGSQNSIFFTGERVVATIGLKDMVVVDTPDATLITPKNRVQDVREVVKRLKQNGREEHLIHKTVERPWGSYTVLEKGDHYKIKRVVLNSGARLSLQLHKRRSEHWVVVSGVAKVTNDEKTYLVRTNESTYIPVHAKHRLENPEEIPLQLIEVQSGEYLEEDDIERFEDDFGRVTLSPPADD